MTFETVLDKNLNTNSTGWHGQTRVQVIPSATIGAAQKIKLTLTGASTKPLGVLSMYVGERGANNFSFATSPAQVKVSGAAAFDVPQNGHIVTDEIEIEFSGEKDLVISAAYTTDTSKNDLRVLFGGGTGCSYYWKLNVNEASLVSKTGYDSAGNNPNALGMISKIEVIRPEEEEQEPPPSYDTPIIYVRDDTYCADWPVEIVGSIEAAHYDINNPRKFTRVTHVKIPHCLPNDVIDVDSLIEITSEFPLVEFSAGLILTPDATGTGGIVDYVGSQFKIGQGHNPANGVWITKFPGKNVSLQTHHDFIPLSGKVIVPEGMSGTLYAAVIAYVWGPNYSPSGQYVTVEPHAGHIQANIRRKQSL